MATRKTKQEVSYDEIKLQLQEIKELLARREHLDVAIQEMKHEFEGNGKPGFRALRDKFMGWEGKINAIIMLVIGDIVVRLIQYAF